MMRSMFSGVSGLRNHQMRMDVIGNNIANVNTVGFKASRVTFQEIFNQTLRGAAAPTSVVGGTDPMQVGLGMTVASIDTINTPGNIQTTGQITDLAIQGEGYFVVTDGATRYYTRAGDFKLDGAHYLTNSKGLRVMGWTAIDGVFEAKDASTLSNLRIHVGEIDGVQIAGAASPYTVSMNTGNTTVLEGKNRWVLDITSGTVRNDVSVRDLTITGLPEGLTAQAAKDPAGNRIIVTVSGTAKTPLTSPATVRIVVNESAVLESDAVSSNPFTLSILPAGPAPTVAAIATDPTVYMASDGKTVSSDNTWVFEVNQGTVKDTVSAADISVSGLPEGLFVASAAKDPTGNRIIVTVAGSASGTVTAPVTASVVIKGSAVAEVGAVDSSAVAVTINPEGTPLKVSGRALDSVVTMAPGNTAVSPRDNSWVLDITSGTLKPVLSVPADVTVTGLPAGLSVNCTKDPNGNRLIITVGGSATEPLTEPLDISVTVNGSAVSEGGATGSNSFRVRLWPVASTPATAPTLQSFSIDSAGIITGSFSDGTSKAIAQVALAHFSNPRGLIRQGDGLLSESNNSGTPQYGEAGTGGRGLIAPSSLEMSNVDLASEFTNMIITQRGFQANARIITTSDEMLQELASIKR